MKRIAIIGISGTGKTTVAKKLSSILKFPIIHYDKFVWEKNRREVHEKIVEKKIHEAIKKDTRIMEWYIHPAAKIRLEKADIVIYLDYSWRSAIIGWLQRRWKHRWKTRQEMAEGCIERLDRKYLKVMLTREERPEIEEAIKGFEKKIIRLKNRKETKKFIKELWTSRIKHL